MVRRVCDAVGLYLLSEQERASGVRVNISLRDLTRGHGQELSDSLSKLVLAGIISRNEARGSRPRRYPGGCRTACPGK
jgi:hypothetical protein